MKPLLVASLTLAFALYALAGAATVLLAFARPPQPLPLGTIQWSYEVGYTVDRIERARQIGSGPQAVHAAGEFYIVHARVLAPYGLRPQWNDGDIEVRTFSGRGGTMRGLRFAVDERAQAVLDRKTGRPGPHHLVRGAQEHEELIFDLPADVEQPGLVFLPANDPSALLDPTFGGLWQPHRFNLRYD